MGALKPWNASIDDTEIRNDGKPSEQGITFKLPFKRVTFFFGPASCRFTRDDADRGSADETIEILDMALSALTLSGGVVPGMKNAVICLHIQPRTLPFMDILRPLLPRMLAAIDSKPVITEHRSIPQTLLEAAGHLKECFGAGTIFKLRQTVDEAGSRTLHAAVIWPGRVGDARAALSKFDDWWLARPRPGAGYLTFTHELV